MKAIHRFLPQLIILCASTLTLMAAEEPHTPLNSPQGITIKSVQMINFKRGEGETYKDSKIKRQFFNTPNATVSYLELQKGAVVSTHTHPSEQISYIFKGAVKVTIDENGKKQPPSTYIVRANSDCNVIVLPPNVPHKFEALEDNTIDVDFFTPSRKDWKTDHGSLLRKPKAQPSASTLEN